MSILVITVNWLISGYRNRKTVKCIANNIYSLSLLNARYNAEYKQGRMYDYWRGQLTARCYLYT